MNNKNQQRKSDSSSYWLYLHPYVHLNIKRDLAVIYNTLNGKLREYNKEHHPDIWKVLNRLNRGENLYVVNMKIKEISNSLQQFIMDIRDGFFGDIMKTEWSTGKPIQMKPILNLESTMEDLTIQPRVKILSFDELGDYVGEVTVYINNRCGKGCMLCAKAYKQFNYCHSVRGKNQEVSPEGINQLLTELSTTSAYKINITGGNILLYPRLVELMEMLSKGKLKKNYYINYLNIDSSKDKLLERLNYHELNTLHILFHFPIHSETVAALMLRLINCKISTVYHFVVEKETQMDDIDAIVRRYRMEEVEFHPYYNGTNLGMFQENIFVNREDIQETPLKIREIFTRQSINALNFKNFTIKSNGKVYANVNHSPIGKLGHDSLFEWIKNELSKGKSWGKVRPRLRPCKGCAYNALCPPISNYEYTLGQYNLCNIWSDSRACKHGGLP